MPQVEGLNMLDPSPSHHKLLVELCTVICTRLTTLSHNILLINFGMIVTIDSPTNLGFGIS
jgi:hypothetical protein